MARSHAISFPVVTFLATGAIVFLGIFASTAHMTKSEASSVGDALRQFDAHHYEDIVTSGYDYDPKQRSTVAFFPVYPVISRIVAEATSLCPLMALTCVSNVLLCAASVLFYKYLLVRRSPLRLEQSKRPSENPIENTYSKQLRSATYSMFAFSLLPTTFFFRMPYSESTFLLFALLVFYGMERNWPFLWIAVLVGFGTATRPVGIALVPCLAFHVANQAESVKITVRRMAYLLPIACWGLFCYMAFQLVSFGDPLAFARTQQYWRIHPSYGLLDKAMSLLSWEPVWATYVPGSRYYWDRRGSGENAIMSLAFLNPVYFLGAIVLTAVGARTRWLSASEVLLCGGLLLIPYVAKSFEWGMLSQARFVAVLFPTYIVMGELLSRCPPAVATSALALSGFLLGVYAAMFGAGEPFF